MNIKKLLILAPVAVLSMTSCGKRGVRHDVSDYIVPTKHVQAYDVNKGLNILQLSDLHLGTNCDRQVQYAFIKETIDQAKTYVKEKKGSQLDMIVITGDVFTFGTKEVAKDFCAFMEKQEVDWTMTFGNHDEQCYFSVDWLTGYLNSLSENKDSYLLFKDNQDDDVFGNANFIIPIKNSDGVEQERLYIFDSNRYRYQLGSYGYDCIHYDQIDWYERCFRFNYTRPDYQNIKSLAFFHIPFKEFETYYESANTDKAKAHFARDEGTGEELKTQKEGVSCPKEHTNLFDKFGELQSTKGVFVGHDHINNSAVVTTNNAIDSNMILSFGVKGTDTVYADDNLMGGQIITFIKDKADLEESVVIHPILHKYSDLKEVK